jgi:DNA-binding CsgD family transcriptional regulator
LTRAVARGSSDPEHVEALRRPVVGEGGASFTPQVSLVAGTAERRGVRGGMALLTLTPIPSGAATPTKAWGLSGAERLVLDELVAGRSNREIGQRLFISPETVRTHLTRIYRKLGVRSRLEAAARVSRS